MRTKGEVLEYLRQKDEKDFFGFRFEVLLPFFTFEEAKEFLKPEATKKEWEKEGVSPFTEKEVLKQMKDYMKFAWGKVEDHRGLSAGRSVDKFDAWVWLMGDDEFLRLYRATPYPNYGAPQLKVVCEKYGFEIPKDERVVRMTQGLKCSDDCEEGCGKA